MTRAAYIHTVIMRRVYDTRVMRGARREAPQSLRDGARGQMRRRQRSHASLRVRRQRVRKSIAKEGTC